MADTARICWRRGRRAAERDSVPAGAGYHKGEQTGWFEPFSSWPVAEKGRKWWAHRSANPEQKNPDRDSSNGFGRQTEDYEQRADRPADYYIETTKRRHDDDRYRNVTEPPKP